MQGTTEVDILAKDAIDYFEYDELRAKQDRTGAEMTHEFCHAIGACVEEICDPMFEGERDLEQNLQQRCSDQRNRRCVDF